MSIFFAENVSADLIVLGHPNHSGRSSYVVVGSANMISIGRGITLFVLVVPSLNVIVPENTINICPLVLGSNKCASWCRELYSSFLPRFEVGLGSRNASLPLFQCFYLETRNGHVRFKCPSNQL